MNLRRYLNAGLRQGQTGIRQALQADWRERVAHDSAVVLGTQLVRQLLGLVSSALLARGLGPAGFSLFAVAGVAVTVGGTIADFGLTQSAVRFIAGDRAGDQTQGRPTAVLFVRFKLLAALLVSGLMLLLAGPLARLMGLPPGVGPGLIRLAAAGVLAAALAGSSGAILHALRRFRPLMATQLVNAGLTVVLFLLLFSLGRLTVSGALWVGAITALAGGVAGYWLLPGDWRTAVTRQLFRIRSPAPTESRRLLRFSRWLWLSAILAILAAQADLLLLNRLLPATLVGLYALALNLAFKADLINQTLFTVLLPAVSSLSAPAEYRAYIRRSVVRSLLPAAALLLAFPLARPFIVLVYGADYTASAGIFQALLLAVLFDAVATPLLMLAYPLDMPRLIAAGNGVRLLTLLGVGLLLVPAWGVYGAAAARLAARLAGALLLAPFIYRGLRRKAAIHPAGGIEPPAG